MNMHNAIARKLLCGAAMGAVLATPALGAQARGFDEVKKSGKIIIATEGQFAPFNFFKGAKVTGFEVEVAEAMAAKRGLKVDQGCVAQDAPPEVFFGAQRNERIRAFLGQIAA